MSIHFTKSLAICAFVAVVMLGRVTSGHAEEVAETLSGTQETPPITTQASGKAKFSITADRSISGTVEISGMQGTSAHIHIGAPGQSGPAIITLVKHAKDSWVVPRNAALTEDRYASFKAGNLYVSVESAEHTSGEIRGQIKR